MNHDEKMKERLEGLRKLYEKSPGKAAAKFFMILRETAADNPDRAGGLLDSFARSVEPFPQNTGNEERGKVWGAVAFAYETSDSGDRGENLTRAAKCFRKALGYFTEEAFPDFFAMTMNNLAGVYKKAADGGAGDRDGNLRLAIEGYEAALRIWTKEDHPENFAGSMNNLGNSYMLLFKGERHLNLSRAIDCYSKAMEIFHKKSHPDQYAIITKSMAVAVAELKDLKLDATEEKPN